MKIKRLKLPINQFKKFIDWLFVKNKLSSINFLAGQVNDFYSSKECRGGKAIEEEALHYEIMDIKRSIIDACPLCEGRGYTSGYISAMKCSCMIKFLKIKNKLRNIK